MIGTMGGGGGIAAAISSGVIPGHYGPAPPSSRVVSSDYSVQLDRAGGIGAAGGRIPSSDRASLLDRASTAGSASGVGGGVVERGYDVYNGNPFAHPAPLPSSSSLLLRSRSKSLGEETHQQQQQQQRGVGAGVGGRNNNNSGSPFPPKPEIVGERQRSWHRGGGGGGDRGGGGFGVADVVAQNPQQQQHQHPRGTAAAAPPPSHVPPCRPHHHQPQHSHYQPPPSPKQQQQPRHLSSSVTTPVPSPIMSMKNERGYSFASHSLVNLAAAAATSSLTGPLKRGLSSGSGGGISGGIGGGIGRERAAVGDEKYQQRPNRDTAIPPLPLGGMPSTPPAAISYRDHHNLSSSPGEICTAGRDDWNGREEEEEKAVDGDGPSVVVLSGTGAVEASSGREEGGVSGGGFAAVGTFAAAASDPPPPPSFRPSPSPFRSNDQSLSADVAPAAAPPTSSPKDDSLYADLASPSPWYAVRRPAASASVEADATPASSPRYAPSPGEMREGGTRTTSPGEMAEEKGGHDANDDAVQVQTQVEVRAQQQLAEHTPYQPALAVDTTPAKGSPPQPPPSPRPNPTGAAAAATNDAVVEENEIEKEKELPPLTCASLGDDDKIRKAEDIVAAMVKLADFNACLSGDGVGVPLPSKIQITKAMAILETKIKLKTKEAMCLRKEVQAIQAAERAEEERIAKMAKEEKERIAIEEEQFAREAEESVRMRRKEREENVSTRRRELTAVYESRSSALEENRQTEISRMKATQSDIEGGVVEINSQIAILCQQLQVAEEQMAELDKAQLRRDMERSAAAFPCGGGLVPTEIMAEDETKHDGTGIPTLDYPGKMSELVGRILAENQMIAKRAHLEVLEAIPYFPDAEGTTSSGELSSTAKEDGAGGEITACNYDEKRILISNEEWSNRARRVTGLINAIYTEPTEVPHYHENNDHFIEIAPLIKECIRRKDKKLKSRWTTLAEHYVLRQTMYNEQTVSTGDVSERGGYFSAAGFLLGGRGGEYYDTMNNMESSTSSTPNSGNGGGGASASQANSAVRGNNPYRRPRRGLAPGDIVRSDYEQEQIIAEIAAKEAIEKRIKEGGCSLPRQRGWLENVSLFIAQGIFYVKVICSYTRCIKLCCPR
jgi:hypothetical protein